MNIPLLPEVLSFCGISKADWQEGKHPRAANGQFGSGSGSSGGKSGKTKRKLERRTEAAHQANLGGKAIQTLLGGGSALDKIGWLSTSKPKEHPAEAPAKAPEKKPEAEEPKKPDPSKVGVVYSDGATPESWKIDRKATLDKIKDGTISSGALGFAIDRHKTVIDDTRTKLDEMLANRGKTKAKVVRASPEFAKLAAKRDQMKSDLSEMYDMMMIVSGRKKPHGSEHIRLS